MKSQTPIIRRPTKDEQRAANIKTSDYQISSLTIQSSILFNFGLCSRVYRSKATVTKYNTKKRVSRYRSIFNKFFDCFDLNDRCERFYELISDSSTTIADECGVNIQDIIKGSRTWKTICNAEQIAMKVAPFVRGRSISSRQRQRSNSNFVKNVSGYETSSLDTAMSYNPSEDDIKEVKRITSVLLNLLNKWSAIESTPNKFMKRMMITDSFNSIMHDEFMKSICNEVYDFDGTIRELKNFIMNFLKKNEHSSEKRHSQTLLNEEAVKAQNDILLTIKREHIGQMLTPATLFEYINKHDDITKSTLKTKFNIDITKDKFKDFEELAQYLYAPEMIKDIRESLGVQVRARSKGAIRRGAELIVDLKTTEQDRKRCEKILNGQYDEEKETLKVKKAKLALENSSQLYESAKQSKSQSKKSLRLAKISGDSERISRCQSLYDKACEMVTKLASDVQYAKKALKQAEKQRDLKAEAVKKLKELSEREYNILQSVYEDRGEDSDDEFKELRLNNKKRVDEEDNIPYFTWIFTMDGFNTKASERIVNEFEKSFNAPDDNYVNVTYHEEDETENTVFCVDYPQSSKFYKLFKKKPEICDNLLRQVGDALTKEMKKLVLLCSGKVNVPFESTLNDVLDEALWTY